MSSGNTTLSVHQLSSSAGPDLGLNVNRALRKGIGGAAGAGITRDLGGLVVSSSLTVLGTGNVGALGSPAVGITGSLTTIPDGTGLIRAGAFSGGVFVKSSQIQVTTGSVTSEDGDSRKYEVIAIESSGGSGDVTMSSNTTTDNVIVATDGIGGKAVQQANAALSTGGQSLTLAGTTGNAAPSIFMSADASEDNGDDWEIAVADGGVMTFENDAGGSYAPQLTLTPNSSTAAIVVATGGSLQLGSNLITATSGSVIGSNATEITVGSTDVSTINVAGQLLVGGGFIRDWDNKKRFDIRGDEPLLILDSAEATVITVGETDLSVQLAGDLVVHGANSSLGSYVKQRGLTAAVAMGTLAAGASKVIVELGGAGVAANDVVGFSGVLSLYKVNNVAGSRKSFSFSGVTTKDTSAGSEGAISWTSTDHKEGVTTQAMMDALQLEVKVNASAKWEISIINNGSATIATGGEGQCYVVRTFID